MQQCDTRAGVRALSPDQVDDLLVFQCAQRAKAAAQQAAAELHAASGTVAGLHR